MRPLFLLLSLIIGACGGGSSSSPPVPPPPPPAPATPAVNVDVGIKQLIFSWADVPEATYYRLFENADGHSGFTQIGVNISPGTLSVRREITVHQFDFTNALYMLEACNTSGCNGSTEINAMNETLATIGYFKASNTEREDHFGAAVALSADGHNLAVGTADEDSSTTGINGDQDDNTTEFAGAVYVFRYDGINWSQQAYIKASNTGNEDPAVYFEPQGDGFGRGIALSSDGRTLAAGAVGEDSSAIGVNGDQSDESERDSGAVYLY